MGEVAISVAPTVSIMNEISNSAITEEINDKEIPASKVLESLKNSKEPCRFYLLKKKLEPVKPRLSGKPGDVIDLDGDDLIKEKSKTKSGARNLLSMMKSHNFLPGSNVLKTDKSAVNNPLTNFKMQLEQKMKTKREEEMNKREEYYKKDQVGQTEHVSDEEEEEEDDEYKSDLSSDVSDAEEEKTVIEKDENRLLAIENEENKTVDDVKTSKATSIEKYDTQELNLILNDDTEKLEPINNEVEENFNESSTVEIIGSLITPYQRRQCHDDTVSTNVSNVFAFPPDDTQELEEMDNNVIWKFQTSPSSRYDYENLNNSTPMTEESKRKLMLNKLIDTNNDSFTSQDVLGLLSGRFTGINDKRLENKRCGSFVSTPRRSSESCQNGPLGDLHMDKNISSQQAQEEMLNLLTVPFKTTEVDLVEEEISSKPSNSLKIHDEDALDGFLEENDTGVCEFKVKRRNLFVNDEDEDDEETNERTKLETIQSSKVDNETVNECEEDCSEEEEEENDCDEDEEECNEEYVVDEDDDEMAIFKKIETNKFRDEKGKLRKEFVENEAELSGSEVESDDEENELDDVMEFEAGDFDENLPDDDELRNQVGKIHHNQMLKDDQRRLLYYKEAYLPDGDLPSDSTTRRLRWRPRGDDDDINFHGEFKAEQNNAEDDDDEVQCLYPLNDQRVMFDFQKPQSSSTNLNESELDMNIPSLILSQKVTIRRSTSTISSLAASTGSLQQVLRQHSEYIDLFSEESMTCSSNRESFLTRSKNVLKKMVKENDDSNSFSANNFSKSLFTSDAAASNNNTVKRTNSKNEADDKNIKKMKLFNAKVSSVFEYL